MSARTRRPTTASVAAALLLWAGCGLLAAAVAAPAGMKTPLRSSPGKPTAPIAIHYEFSGKPALGVPFDVRITASAEGMTDLSLTLRANDGLQASVPQLTASSTDGSERTWTLTATAANDGTSYLSVLVQGRRGAEQPARDLLIPVRIGTATPSKAATTIEPKTEAGGERIIVLPAKGSR